MIDVFAWIVLIILVVSAVAMFFRPALCEMVPQLHECALLGPSVDS